MCCGFLTCRRLKPISPCCAGLVKAVNRFVLTTGDTINNIALRLPDHFGELEDELNKSHALSMQKAQVLYDEIFRTTRVLNSMLEGVVAVDRSLRILAANPAARDLLAMSAEPAPGRLLVELVRFPKLTSMVETNTQESAEIGR